MSTVVRHAITLLGVRVLRPRRPALSSTDGSKPDHRGYDFDFDFDDSDDDREFEFDEFGIHFPRP